MQRYVSTELAHFAGRGKASDEQYQILLAILRSGSLLCDPRRPIGSPGVGWINSDGGFSDRKMYHFPGVCFCDIPVADLPLHISKYSSFGIAFTKAFLVKKGASPVFYICKESELDLGGNEEAGIRQSAVGPYTTANLFDEMTKSFNESVDGLLRSAESITEKNGKEALELAKSANKLANLSIYIHGYVFSYCVPFSSSLQESDHQQYYMEREWRVRENVRFELKDLARVFLPSEYAARFRSDLPNYFGELTFSDLLGGRSRA